MNMPMYFSVGFWSFDVTSGLEGIIEINKVKGDEQLFKIFVTITKLSSDSW